MSEIKNKTNQSSGGNYHVISCILSNSTVRDKYTKISYHSAVCMSALVSQYHGCVTEVLTAGT